MTTKYADQRDFVKTVLERAAPERKADIKSLWREYNPKIKVCDNADGVTLNATKERIAYDLKTLDIFWLIGFSGWRAIECYSPYVFVSFMRNKNIEPLISCDRELPAIERDYKERRKAVNSLLNVTNALDIHWPPDLPRPSADCDALNNVQYQATFLPDTPGTRIRSVS